MLLHILVCYTKAWYSIAIVITPHRNSVQDEWYMRYDRSLVAELTSCMRPLHPPNTDSSNT